MNRARELSWGLAILSAFLLGACASSTEPEIPEHNVGFFLRSNLPCTQGEVNGRDATLAIATALPRTAIRSTLRDGRPGTRILLGSTMLTYVRSTGLDIDDIPADGLLGADAFRGRIATLDYFRGLLTVSDWPRSRPEITPWSFEGGPPRVPVRINGQAVWAIVDSAMPDTAIVTPEAAGALSGGRGTILLEIAGIRFDALDVAVAPVTSPRIGSRVLSRFIVTIDYAHEMIGLWPDPRTSDAKAR